MQISFSTKNVHEARKRLQSDRYDWLRKMAEEKGADWDSVVDKVCEMIVGEKVRVQDPMMYSSPALEFISGKAGDEFIDFLDSGGAKGGKNELDQAR